MPHALEEYTVPDISARLITCGCTDTAGANLTTKIPWPSCRHFESEVTSVKTKYPQTSLTWNNMAKFLNRWPFPFAVSDFTFVRFAFAMNGCIFALAVYLLRVLPA